MGRISLQARSACSRRRACSSETSKSIFDSRMNSSSGGIRLRPPALLPNPFLDVLRDFVQRAPRAIEPCNPQLQELGLVLLRDYPSPHHHDVPSPLLLQQLLHL